MSYLDNFLATVEEAPKELRDALSRMRALDATAQEATDNVRKAARQHVSKARRAVSEGSAPPEESLAKMETYYHKQEAAADEKIQIAYDMAEKVCSQWRGGRTATRT